MKSKQDDLTFPKKTHNTRHSENCCTSSKYYSSVKTKTYYYFPIVLNVKKLFKMLINIFKMSKIFSLLKNTFTQNLSWIKTCLIFAKKKKVSSSSDFMLVYVLTFKRLHRPKTGQQFLFHFPHKSVFVLNIQ